MSHIKNPSRRPIGLSIMYIFKHHNSDTAGPSAVDDAAAASSSKQQSEEQDVFWAGGAADAHAPRRGEITGGGVAARSAAGD